MSLRSAVRAGTGRRTRTAVSSVHTGVRTAETRGSRRRPPRFPPPTPVLPPVPTVAPPALLRGPARASADSRAPATRACARPPPAPVPSPPAPHCRPPPRASVPVPELPPVDRCPPAPPAHARRRRRGRRCRRCRLPTACRPAGRNTQLLPEETSRGRSPPSRRQTATTSPALYPIYRESYVSTSATAATGAGATWSMARRRSWASVWPLRAANTMASAASCMRLTSPLPSTEGASMIR